MADSIKFRKAPVFVNAQVGFTVVTIMGGVMADFAPLTMVGSTTTFRCMLFPTWLLIAITLLYGPLVLKTYRVWKILDNPSLRNIKVPTFKLLGMLGVFVVFELLLAVVLGFTSPIYAQIFDDQFSDYATFERTRCQDGDPAVFVLIVYVLTAVPITAGLYLAFKTRHFMGKYTENRSILGAFYTLALAALVVIPMTIVFEGSNLVFSYVFTSVAILLVSSVSVFTFMIPKVLFHRGVKVHVSSSGSSHKDTAGTCNVTKLTSLQMAGGIDEQAELKEELLEARETIADLRERLAEWRRRSVMSQ